MCARMKINRDRRISAANIVVEAANGAITPMRTFRTGRASKG